MLEYFKIFFPIFFAFNKQKKVKEVCVKSFCASFPFMEAGTATDGYNECNQ